MTACLALWLLWPCRWPNSDNDLAPHMKSSRRVLSDSEPRKRRSAGRRGPLGARQATRGEFLGYTQVQYVGMGGLFWASSSLLGALTLTQVLLRTYCTCVHTVHTVATLPWLPSHNMLGEKNARSVIAPWAIPSPDSPSSPGGLIAHLVPPSLHLRAEPIPHPPSAPQGKSKDPNSR